MASLPVVWMSARGRLVTALIVAVTAIHSAIVTAPLDPLPPGRIETEGVMAGDIVSARHGPFALVDVGSGPILADLPASADASRGDVVWIEGTVVAGAGRSGAVPIGARWMSPPSGSCRGPILRSSLSGMPCVTG